MVVGVAREERVKSEVMVGVEVIEARGPVGVEDREVLPLMLEVEVRRGVVEVVGEVVLVARGLGEEVWEVEVEGVEVEQGVELREGVAAAEAEFVRVALAVAVEDWVERGEEVGEREGEVVVEGVTVPLPLVEVVGVRVGVVDWEGDTGGEADCVALCVAGGEGEARVVVDGEGITVSVPLEGDTEEEVEGEVVEVEEGGWLSLPLLGLTLGVVAGVEDRDGEGLAV